MRMPAEKGGKRIGSWHGENTRPFTLIELLVVIAIIALLAGMLLPVMNKAKAKAHESQCMSQLKQIATGLIMYQDDHDEEMSPWISTLVPDYVGVADVYHCPRDGNPEDTADADWDSRPDRQFGNANDRPGNTGIYGINPNPDVTKISYFYECSHAKCDWNLPGSGLTGTYSWGELKEFQLNSGNNGKPYETVEFPIVRCSWHLRDRRKVSSPTNAPVLNIAWAGNFFLSMNEWEQGTWSP